MSDELDAERFNMLPDEAISASIVSRLPINTQKNIRWASKIFYSWRRARSNKILAGELDGQCMSKLQ